MFIVGVVGIQNSLSIVKAISELLKLNNYKVNVIKSLKDNKNLTSKSLKDYIKTLNRNNTDILLINITPDEIVNEYYKDINFDAVVLATEENETDQLQDESKNDFFIYKNIFEKLKKKSFTIINIDDKVHIKQLQGVETCIITYGFNSKSTITASSVDDNDNKLLICQQRIIKSALNNKITPQEIIVNLKEYNQQNIYNGLAAVATCLIFNINDKILTNYTF